MDLLLSEAVVKFTLARQVEGCAPSTLRSYAHDLDRLMVHVGRTKPLAAITADDLRGFLGKLQTTRIAPAGIAPRPAIILAPKTIKNVHTTLRSLWRWALEEGHVSENVPAQITAPHPSPAAVDPFTRDEVLLVLHAIDHSQPWRNRPGTRNVQPIDQRRRDRAIVLVLLDTGIRASELCGLVVDDYNPRTGSITVRGKSRLNSGQGKERVVYAEGETVKALNTYLKWRRVDAGAPLFANAEGTPLTRQHLALHLRRLGRRAGVRKVHPHRFRHTFAIEYLRAGGDAYTLQRLLGHSSLDMVKRYLAIAQADCAAVHRRCSPVANWL